MSRTDKLAVPSIMKSSNLRMPTRFAKLDAKILEEHFALPPELDMPSQTLDMTDYAMTPTIPKDATLWVEYDTTPVHNDIVIARVYGEIICRRIFISKRKSWLYADNKNYDFIKLEQNADVTILGVVTSHYITHQEAKHG